MRTYLHPQLDLDTPIAQQYSSKSMGRMMIRSMKLTGNDGMPLNPVPSMELKRRTRNDRPPQGLSRLHESDDLRIFLDLVHKK